MELDDTICYCFHISKRKILNHIRIYKPKRASQVSECGGAGTGCGWCVPFLKRYFEAYPSSAASASSMATVSPGLSEPAAVPARDEALSPDEYAKLRADYIRAGKGKPAAGAIPIPPSAQPEEEGNSPPE